MDSYVSPIPVKSIFAFKTIFITVKSIKYLFLYLVSQTINKGLKTGMTMGRTIRRKKMTITKLSSVISFRNHKLKPF